MRLRLIPLMIVPLFLLGADKPTEEEIKKELDKLKGPWIIQSWTQNGKADDVRKGGKVVFTGDAFERKAGKETVKGKIKIDPKAKPKTIDTTETEGPFKDKPLLGIYQLDGDTWKICYADAGTKDRPKEFESKAGSKNLLLVLQKEKAVAKAAPPMPPAPPPPPPPPPVAFEAPLEAAVRAVLQEPKAPLTEANLINVYVLEASGKGIQNLKGLDKCKNLSLLKLTGNKISDVSALKDLTNLQSLDLAGNQISDIKPLAGLTKLQYLELSNNQIADVTPLKGLSALSALYLTNNKISDVAPLGELVKLSSLSLGKNKIKDISGLAKVNRLSTLDLNDNLIEDVKPLTKQTELSLLMLERNKITDLAPLIAMSKADAEGAKRFAPYLRLYLKGNPMPLDALKQYGVRVDY